MVPLTKPDTAANPLTANGAISPVTVTAPETLFPTARLFKFTPTVTLPEIDPVTIKLEIVPFTVKPPARSWATVIEVRPQLTVIVADAVTDPVTEMEVPEPPMWTAPVMFWPTMMLLTEPVTVRATRLRSTFKVPLRLALMVALIRFP